MAKRRVKKRTTPAVVSDAPKSMVLSLGASLRNKSLAQLVKDFRLTMEPHTAINLRERKANKLKDFVVMTGPLGVTDLFVFKQLEASGNVSLRIAKMPRGPSLQFRVNSYSLMKDVARFMKRPHAAGRELPAYKEPPLLVMNGFSKVAEMQPHEKLMVTVFQNLFPAIQPHSTRVQNIKRVLLLTRTEAGEIELRHYLIETKMVEESRNIKKLINSHRNARKLPNMQAHADISALVLDPYAVGGLTSDSEVEDDAVVEVQSSAQKVRGKTAEKVPAPDAAADTATTTTRKRAIKLHELGPRLNLSLVKIEEALLGSLKTIYHAHVSKLRQEEKELEKRHQERLQEKAKRRALQKANVDAKVAKKEAKKAKKKAKKVAFEPAAGEPEQQDSASDSDSDAPQINPSDYENDSDLFSDVE